MRGTHVPVGRARGPCRPARAATVVVVAVAVAHLIGIRSASAQAKVDPRGAAAALRDTKTEATKTVPLRYTVEVTRAAPAAVRRGPPAPPEGELPGDGNAKPLPPPDGEIDVNGMLSLTAKLHNDGDQPVRVFWGDYAYPAMYRFEITHASGWKPPRTRYWPDDYVPSLANEQYFVTIPAKGFVAYDLHLAAVPGANCQWCWFSRPGRYEIVPALTIAARQVLDETTGAVRDVPGAWTGQLTASPLAIVVKPLADPNRQGLRLRGKVIDTAGAPIARALIVVRVESTSPGAFDGVVWHEIGQDQTNAEGNFELVGLPANSPAFALTIRHLEHLTAQEMVVNDPPDRLPEAALETRVTLTPGREVRGRVIDREGQPVADARFSYRGREVYSDDEGRFILRGLGVTEGDQVAVWRRGFAEQVLAIAPAAGAARFLRVTLGRERDQTVSGVAEFIDRRTVANVALVFRMEPVDPDEAPRMPEAYQVTAPTDSSGKFQMVLPAPTRFRVLQVEARDNGGDAHALEKIWRTSLGEVGPGDENIRLRFDDTHRIVAEIRPVRPLPPTLQLRVTCSLDELARPIVGSATLGHEGGQLAFDRLSPGKYRIAVGLLPDARISASRGVEIPRDAKPIPGAPDAKLRFDFPDVQFGGLKGVVVKADGTPAGDVVVRFAGRAADANGRTDRDGRFELSDLVAGAGWVSPALKGFDGPGLPVDVAAGKVGEPVRLVLTPLSSIVGRVTGRITLDDGRPALGASLGDRPLPGSDLAVGSFDKQAVDSAGTYTAEVRNDQPQFAIDLRAVRLWNRQGNRPPPGFAGKATFGADRLLVTVPIEPGKTITRDIVLDRKRRGPLTLRWKGPPPLQATLFVSVVPLRSDAQARSGEDRFDQHLSFQRVGSIRFEPDGSFVLPDVPFGRRVVLLMTGDPGSSQIVRVRTPSPDEPDVALTFDPADDGALRVRIVDRLGRPADLAAYSLRLSVNGMERFVAGSPPTNSPDRITDEAPPPDPHREGAGTYVFPNLEPRSYELHLQSGSYSKTLSVEVKSRETATIEVKLDQ